MHRAMKRLLFALLAILTGLAASGTPVLAAVEAQSIATAGVPRHGIAECRATSATCTIPASRLSGYEPDGAMLHAAANELATPTVRLQVDRARE